MSILKVEGPIASQSHLLYLVGTTFCIGVLTYEKVNFINKICSRFRYIAATKCSWTIVSMCSRHWNLYKQIYMKFLYEMFHIEACSIYFLWKERDFGGQI